jgi:hypothetical protein
MWRQGALEPRRNGENSVRTRSNRPRTCSARVTSAWTMTPSEPARRTLARVSSAAFLF